MYRADIHRELFGRLPALKREKRRAPAIESAARATLFACANDASHALGQGQCAHLRIAAMNGTVAALKLLYALDNSTDKYCVELHHELFTILRKTDRMNPHGPKIDTLAVHELAAAAMAIANHQTCQISQSVKFHVLKGNSHIQEDPNHQTFAPEIPSFRREPGADERHPHLQGSTQEVLPSPPICQDPLQQDPEGSIPEVLPSPLTCQDPLQEDPEVSTPEVLPSPLTCQDPLQEDPEVSTPEALSQPSTSQEQPHKCNQSTAPEAFPSPTSCQDYFYTHNQSAASDHRATLRELAMDAAVAGLRIVYSIEDALT